MIRERCLFVFQLRWSKVKVVLSHSKKSDRIHCRQDTDRTISSRSLKLWTFDQHTQWKMPIVFQDRRSSSRLYCHIVKRDRIHCRQDTDWTESSRILQLGTIDHHEEDAYCYSRSEVKVIVSLLKSLTSRVSLIQTEALNTFLFFVLKVKTVCWQVSVDNLVPSMACELQVILYGRDISIQFEISNKWKCCMHVQK